MQWRQACTQEICRFSSDCSSTWICLRLQKIIHQNNTAARNCNMEICPWRHSNISKACEMQWFGWSCFLLMFAARSLGGWHRWYLNKSPFCAVLYFYFLFTKKKTFQKEISIKIVLPPVIFAHHSPSILTKKPIPKKHVPLCFLSILAKGDTYPSSSLHYTTPNPKEINTNSPTFNLFGDFCVHFLYPSSQNHGSVENGSPPLNINYILLDPDPFFTEPWTMWEEFR